jgi:hypothetical protein
MAETGDIGMDEPRRRVIILAGLSGSGKSMYAESFETPALICSADHYFISNVIGYVFDPTRLGAAHGACLRLYIDRVRRAPGHGDRPLPPLVVVDNTNTTIVELAPLAEAYEIPYEIHVCDVTPEIALHRNSHGVPAQVIARMYENLRRAVYEVRQGGAPCIRSGKLHPGRAQDHLCDEQCSNSAQGLTSSATGL